MINKMLYGKMQFINQSEHAQMQLNYNSVIAQLAQWQQCRVAEEG